MTPVLVTGGSGFIGQHLVSQLVARGRRVRVLDVSAPVRPLSAVEYIKGSILDTRVVDDAAAGVGEGVAACVGGLTAAGVAVICG